MTNRLGRATGKLRFLKNVALFTFTAFGGAQAHMALLLKFFVKQDRYISEEELLELNALAQVLPGPASTQTLVGVAYKVGGIGLSLLTFLIWIIPSAAVMTAAAISYSTLDHKERFIEIIRYIEPIALGIVAYGAFNLARKVLATQLSIFLAISAVIATLVLRNAYVFPIAILIGGMISSSIETPREENDPVL
jgi:chromate transporter